MPMSFLRGIPSCAGVSRAGEFADSPALFPFPRTMLNYITAKKMKKSILLGLIIIARGAVSVAQHTDCNRAVWFNRFTNLLPKEVCIPKGNYHITHVYERADINEDGLEDFIFDWNKKTLQDGDTLYVTIYAQNRDSTFSHF